MRLGCFGSCGVCGKVALITRATTVVRNIFKRHGVPPKITLSSEQIDVDDYAYYKNTVDGKFYEWVGHNTPDTWSQGSYIDDPAIWGYHFPKYDESLTNWSANPPKVAVDGDTAINLNRMPEFHCNYTTNPPSDKRDMQSHGVHEYGHVWGLGHDSQDTTGATAMYRLGLKGLPGLHRRPEPRDVGRAKFIYGSK